MELRHSSCFSEWLQVEGWLIMQTLHWGSRGFTSLLKVILTIAAEGQLHVKFICTALNHSNTLTGLTGKHESRNKGTCRGGQRKEKREETNDLNRHSKMEVPRGHHKMSFSFKISSIVSHFFYYYAKTTQNWTGYNCIWGWNMWLTQHKGPEDIKM